MLIPSRALCANADAGAEARNTLKDIAGLVDHPSGSPVSGTGDAVVVEDRDGKRKESRVEFRFKENLSRSDVFDYIGGEKGALRIVYSTNQTNSVSYNGYNAVVQASPPAAFYRMPRMDFHPETFARVHENPISTWLTGMAEHAPALTINLDPNGVLHVEVRGEFEGGRRKEFHSVSLDSTKGYRLVGWELYNEDRGTILKESYTADWQQTGSAWYIKEACIHHMDTREGKAGTKPKTSHLDVRMVVSNFVANAPLEDSEFTLTALKLPYGTLVSDEIVGVDYKYGSGVRGTQRLEEPLREAEFVKIINSEPDGNAISASTADRDGDRGGLLAETESPAHPYAIRTCLLLIVTICVGIVLLLGIVRQRVKGKGGLGKEGVSP